MKVSLTVSVSDPSGEMDDVLDNICSIFHRGSLHRYVPLLVSAALSPLYCFYFCTENSCFPIGL